MLTGFQQRIQNLDKVRVAFYRMSCIFQPQSIDLTSFRGTYQPRNYFKVLGFVSGVYMISARENLHSATLELVRSIPIKQRLISAYRRHLAAVAEDQLPSEVRGSFAQVMRSLAGVQPLRGEDAVVASVRKMSNQEADDCAALIVEIFGVMCRADVSSARQSAGHSATRQSADVSSARQSADVVQLRNPECTLTEFEAAALIASN